jgi:hypothetical protein
MKKIIFTLALITFLGSCKKDNTEALIDFSANRIYTVFEIRQLKTTVDCNVLIPYWSNKTLKIRGLLGKTNLGIPDITSLGITANAIFGDSTFQKAIGLKFAVADSANIMKKIKANPLRTCIIKVVGDDISLSGTGCDKIFFPRIENAEDIEIQ